MLDTVFGLPVHALLVHATVVVVPSAALAVALAAVWPRFRRWAAYLPLLLSLVALVLVPLSTSSGESLERRVPETALVERHTQLGEGLLVWVIVLAVAAAALTWMRRREAASTTEVSSEESAQAHATHALPRHAAALTAAVLVLSAVGVVGTVVQVVRIGHSGAEAAWSDVGATSGSEAPTDGDD